MADMYGRTGQYNYNFLQTNHENTGCSIKQFTSGSEEGAYRFISEQKHLDLGRKKVLR